MAWSCRKQPISQHSRPSPLDFTLCSVQHHDDNICSPGHGYHLTASPLPCKGRERLYRGEENGAEQLQLYETQRLPQMKLLRYHKGTVLCYIPVLAVIPWWVSGYRVGRAKILGNDCGLKHAAVRQEHQPQLEA